MFKLPSLTTQRHRQAGFTLIEILVALAILSVGLLGMAALQNTGLRSNYSALTRSQATMKCEDILDRMRANRTAALSNDYDIAIGVVPTSPTYSGMTLTDLNQWKTGLAAILPSGDGSVSVNGTVATVVVQWGESSGNQTVSVVTRL